ncbi:HTH-type transcriptional activator Btr [compost metagenome]
MALGNLPGEYKAEASRLQGWLEALSDEFATQQPGRAAALQSLTRLIMISLLRLCPNSLESTPARHEDLKIFHRFNALIEAHYLEHWPLARYAQQIGVTEARLNDVCRRIADLPSKRLVLERLMQEAKRLLLFSGSTANEICYQLGFKDPAYFSRFFNRYAKLTPGEYRQRQAELQ